MAIRKRRRVRVSPIARDAQGLVLAKKAVDIPLSTVLFDEERDDAGYIVWLKPGKTPLKGEVTIHWLETGELSRLTVGELRREQCLRPERFGELLINGSLGSVWFRVYIDDGREKKSGDSLKGPIFYVTRSQDDDGEFFLFLHREGRPALEVSSLEEAVSFAVLIAEQDHQPESQPTP